MKPGSADDAHVFAVFFFHSFYLPPIPNGGCLIGFEGLIDPEALGDDEGRAVAEEMEVRA